MKALNKLSLALCSGLLMAGVLSGCQAEQGEKAVELEGLWVIEAIESEDDAVAMDAEEVDLFNYALGTTISIDLQADGNAVLKVFDEVKTGTWTKAEDGSATLTIANYGEAVDAEVAAGAVMTEEEKIEGVELVIEGETLVVAIDGARYIFITEAAEAAAQEAEAAEVAANTEALAQARAEEEAAGLALEAETKAE